MVTTPRSRPVSGEPPTASAQGRTPHGLPATSPYRRHASPKRVAMVRIVPWLWATMTISS